MKPIKLPLFALPTPQPTTEAQTPAADSTAKQPGWRYGLPMKTLAYLLFVAAATGLCGCALGLFYAFFEPNFYVNISHTRDWLLAEWTSDSAGYLISCLEDGDGTVPPDFAAHFPDRDFEVVEQDGGAVLWSSRRPGVDYYTIQMVDILHLSPQTYESLLAAHAAPAAPEASAAEPVESQQADIPESHPHHLVTVNVLLNTHPDPAPQKSPYATVTDFCNWLYTLRTSLWLPSLLFAALALCSFIYLMHAAGRRPHQPDIRGGGLVQLPLELYGVLIGTAELLVLWPSVLVIDECDGFIVFFALLFATAATITLGTAVCMNLAVRFKLGAWWRGTLCFWCLALAWRALGWCWRLCCGFWGFVRSFCSGLPLVRRGALILIGGAALNLLRYLSAPYHFHTFLFLELLLLCIGGIWLLICLQRLQHGAEMLADGDLSYRIDTKLMPPTLRRHAETLNGLRTGMSRAVEQQLRSERFKTELITNVSHDIKTPLTSIINYADLIAKEPTDNPTIQEYSTVLLRQSTKLKRLIEDLVEASKASTGNLEIHLAPCDLKIIAGQMMGEYQQRLNDRALTLMVTLPEEPVPIQADGRRLWRVFDNLMSNIYKYAQPGTRVYVTLEQQEECAVLTFKNISEQPLNIPAEELLQRFKRGDAARSTEGNGLGLSIAQSLTELQNGSLKLAVDADLFTATLTFPLDR